MLRGNIIYEIKAMFGTKRHSDFGKEWGMKGPESFHETSIMTLTDVRVNLNVIMGLDV